MAEKNEPAKTITSNLFKSKDEFVRDRRKEKELKARMRIEEDRIMDELEKEGAKDLGEDDGIKTVEQVKGKKGK